MNKSLSVTMNQSKEMLAKVPEITLYFWITKLLTTGMGEVASDYLFENLENQRGFAMDNKVDEDFIRQLGKSLLETYGKDKTVQLIKELERLVRIQASYEKAVEQNGEALRRLED